jgi:hypothetical protein
MRYAAVAAAICCWLVSIAAHASAAADAHQHGASTGRKLLAQTLVGALLSFLCALARASSRSLT